SGVAVVWASVASRTALLWATTSSSLGLRGSRGLPSWWAPAPSMSLGPFSPFPSLISVLGPSAGGEGLGFGNFLMGRPKSSRSWDATGPLAPLGPPRPPGPPWRVEEIVVLPAGDSLLAAMSAG